jgi:hypothetical protein
MQLQQLQQLTTAPSHKPMNLSLVSVLAALFA